MLNDDGHSLSLTAIAKLSQQTTELKTAKNTYKHTPNGAVSFLEKVIFDPVLSIFDPFLVDTHGPKYPKMRLNGHLVGKTRL